MENKNYYIFDDIFSVKELLWIYHLVLDSNSWYLTRGSKNDKSKYFNNFPGMIIEENGNIYEKYLSGYFKSIIFRVQKNIKKNNFEIPDNVIRIALGAKSSLSKTSFHFDNGNKDCWTILGFLNPIWDPKDGGEFYLEKEKIDYLPGRIIVFPSYLEHNGGYVNNEKLNYWRISLNIVLGK